MHALSLSHVQLCDPTECSPPGSSVQGVILARIQKWVAITFSRKSSLPRDKTCVFCITCIGRWILYHCASWGAQHFQQTILTVIAHMFFWTDVL